jgi:dTDP-glucose 4,6-dehydratase
MEVVNHICGVLNELLPAAENPMLVAQGIRAYTALKTLVADRPGHDRRHAIDATKIRQELGWRPRHDFDAGIRRTVRWYLEHRDWCEAVQVGPYRRERLGLTAARNR